MLLLPLKKKKKKKKERKKICVGFSIGFLGVRLSSSCFWSFDFKIRNFTEQERFPDISQKHCDMSLAALDQNAARLLIHKTGLAHSNV